MNASGNPKYNILVVDDDLDVNTTLALMIEFDGHKVQTAYTGEAALAMLQKGKFDLIIMEYWLPLMKGDELVKLVKRQWPDLPIIMATSTTEELDKDVHPIAGVDCLLNKPFSMAQLRDAMVWVFERYEERRQRDLGIHEAQAGLLVEKPDQTRSAPKGDSQH